MAQFSSILQKVILVSVLVHLSAGCRNDTIWDLITCGYKAKLHMATSFDLCSDNDIYNRDRIVAAFTQCANGYMYDTCSAEQQQGYVIDRFQEAFNAIPCTVTKTSGCVENTINCISESAKKVALKTIYGLPCFCRDRQDLLDELTSCLEQSTADLNDASCTASDDDKALLTEGITKLEAALADKDCSSVDEGKCTCWEELHDCIYGTGKMQGSFSYFLSQHWSLIEVAALEDVNMIKLEETRAWRRYQQCRTDGFPDQYDRAVICLENMSSQCGVTFPDTLAFSEHFSNTTFYQTGAAAVKNVQQFCHVWCRNTTLWTGNMVNCLESFHPADVQVDRSNIIEYILDLHRNSPADLKAICDAEKADPAQPLDMQLTCSAEAIERCYYLPYHLIIAGKFQFEYTLTASDAMEALYAVLLACEIDVVEWASNVINSGQNAATDYNKDVEQAFAGFFSNAANKNYSLQELTLLTICMLFLAKIFIAEMGST